MQNSIRIDGKDFSEAIQKFYTEEDYKKSSKNLKYCFIELLKRDIEGRFHIGENNSWDKGPIKTIGYAVLDWYKIMPKSVRKAIDNFDSNSNITNAGKLLVAIKKAMENSKNNLPISAYPCIVADDNRDWAHSVVIELREYDNKISFSSWGDFDISPRLRKDLNLETKDKSLEKIIEDAIEKNVSVKRLILRGGSPYLDFSASRYQPNKDAYEMFCKSYAENHPIELLNTYKFYSKKLRHGYNPWHNTHTSTEETVSYDVRAKNKKEAYEQFKKLVEEKNNGYSRMWFPGTEGRPHEKACPLSKGKLVFKPCKDEIYYY